MAVNIRMPDDLRDKLREIAKQEHRSVSNLIVKILMDWLKNREKSTK